MILENGGQACHADGLFLKKNREQALTMQKCNNTDASRRRVADDDARHPSKGEIDMAIAAGSVFARQIPRLTTNGGRLRSAQSVDA